MSSVFQAEIDQVTEPQWNCVLNRFRDASIYQTWTYGAIRWGADNLSHLVLRNGDDIVSAAQVRIIKFPVLKAGIGYIRWGPMWRTGGDNGGTKKFRIMLKALRDEYVHKRGLILRLVPNIRAGADDLSSVLESAGFRKNIQQPYRTIYLDLNLSLDELRKKLVQKWRNQLNRAEKNGLTIIEGEEDELFQHFLELQGQMRERKKYIPGVSYDEFRRMQAALPSGLKMRIMVGLHNGERIAAAICAAAGDTGIYLLGATGNNGMQLKGSYILQWRMIKWLKDNGYRYYDLGGIDPDANPGVYHFKAGLSGVETRYLGYFDYCRGFSNSFILKTIGAINAIKKYFA